MNEAPGNIKSAAILQMVSGVINVFFTSVTLGLGATVCAVPTMGLSGLCGIFGCLMGPLGFVEIIVGAMALQNPKNAGMLRNVAYLEMMSFFFGGLIAAVAGGMVLSMTNDADVKAYLEG